MESLLCRQCCQLIKREFLFDSGVRFIPCILQEDNAFTVELLLHAQRVSHENRAFYIRRVRPPGSIMTKKPGFANAYGYFRCVEALMPYLADASYHQETREALSVFIQSLIRNMSHIYIFLKQEEKGKINVLSSTEQDKMLWLLKSRKSMD